MNYAPLLPLSMPGARQTGGVVGRVPQIGFTPPASRVIPMPINGSAAKDLDVVQFLSKVFYVNETDSTAVIRVIRLGSLQGSCSVKWKTEDFSAKAGRKYHGGTDELKFGPGESVRSFEVKIINDDNFDTALEFDVILFDPQNCIMDPKNTTSSVMIIDDDQFPSNDFKAEVDAKDEGALYDVGFSLLWSFMKFCFIHVDDIWWKTILNLLLANLGNAYYLATIFIKVYLIDTVLNIKDEHSADRLWIPGDRDGTAICLGLAWVLPNFILLGTDYFEMRVLEMGFNIRYHLRVNLFRKYLRYTKESKAMVPIQDLKISIMEDIPDMVSDGYLILFELWAMLGKIAMVTIFMLKKTPGNALAPLAVYPLLIAIYLTRTYKRRLELMAKEGEGQSATIGTLMHAHNNHKLINAYEKKTTVVRYFENVLLQQRKGVMDLKSFTFWNAQLIPWITLLAIGFYIGASAKMVLSHRISLGALVTTINVYKDLGDRFSTILDGLKALSKAISPLSGLTIQFNLETDIPQKSKVFEMNQKFALEYGNQVARNFDLVPIVFEKIQLDQSPVVMKAGSELNLEAHQGTVVQIIGPHDSGKGAILRRICDGDLSSPGIVRLSPHLVVLQVPHEPLFLEGGGVFANLHMAAIGQKGFDAKATARGRRILQRLGLGKSWIMEQYDLEESSSLMPMEEKMMPVSPMSCHEEEEEEEDEEEEGNPTWSQNLSGSEKWRFQLARAFLHDPHVLVVHRPVDELDSNLKDTVLGLFREFVDKKGLEIDEDAGLDMNHRRPRTLIFTAGTSTSIAPHIPIPDVAWRISESGINVERRHGFGSHGSPAFTAAPVGVPGMTQTVQNGAFGSMSPR